MYHHLRHSEILCFSHNAFMCFVWISEQRAIISLYSINLSVFITEAESVYSAVRTGSLNQTDTVSSLKSQYSEILYGAFITCVGFIRISEQRATFALYDINRVVLYNRSWECLLRSTYSVHIKQTFFLCKGLRIKWAVSSPSACPHGVYRHSYQ